MCFCHALEPMVPAFPRHVGRAVRRKWWTETLMVIWAINTKQMPLAFCWQSCCSPCNFRPMTRRISTLPYMRSKASTFPSTTAHFVDFRGRPQLLEERLTLLLHDLTSLALMATCRSGASSAWTRLSHSSSPSCTSPSTEETRQEVSGNGRKHRACKSRQGDRTLVFVKLKRS